MLFQMILTISLIPSAGFPQADQVATRFRELDSNGDGKLSAEELNGAPSLRTRFQGADKNRDGFLTVEEIRAHLALENKIAREKNTTSKVGPESSLKEGPRMLPPVVAGVGHMVSDTTIKDIEGRECRLKDLISTNGLVVAFTNTTCPISRKYGPTLANLEKEWIGKGLPFVFINPTENEKLEDMKAFVANHKLKGRYFHDSKGLFSKSMGATTTAEIFLLDRKRTVVYRGAIDDQYGLGYSLEAPRRQFLRGAVAALFANRLPDPAATTAPGCDLDLNHVGGLKSEVTYHDRISRIIQSNCIECHRNGGVGPFSLETPADLGAHSGMIRKVVENGTMPPWFAAPPREGQLSPWVNDRSLPQRDKNDLLAWLKSDRPTGDVADKPLPRTFEGGWLIGKPDAVFQFAKPVEVKATGTMEYENVTVETHLKEDKWVKAVEVRPTAKGVVHHVLVFVDSPDNGETGSVAVPVENGLNGYFAIYVPGQSHMSYPDGYAKRLPKGSKLNFQMHYTPNGTAASDQTQIGFVFADKPPLHEVRVAGLFNTDLKIPPGADNHPESAQQSFPFNATILGFLPHMHLRGKSFRYEMTPPNGKTETILDIPRYDFNWQLYYRLAEPRPVVSGTKVKVTGWFDNSEKNPANPDPKRTVPWGSQTTDEMMLGYVEFVVPYKDPVGASGENGGSTGHSKLFQRVDTNRDGKISKVEYDVFVSQMPKIKDKPMEAQKLFERLDSNKDGTISLEELKKVGKIE